jgi:small-conductance mechanosensitive channel
VDQLFNVESWRQIVLGALTQLGTSIGAFLPNLAGALLILLVGWVVSRVVAATARRGLRLVGLDRASSRLGLPELIERAEIKLTLSEIVAELLFWLLMLTFVLSSVESLGLVAVTATIDRLIAFIPNVIGAALVAVLGLLLARFVRALVRSGAAAAGFESAARLGAFAQTLVVLFVAAVAAEQLGVATEILVAPITALIATVGLAFGLAFALGARPVITHILAGHFLRQSLPQEETVEIGGRRGRVERVGAVDTLLRGDDGAWSVPNGRLLEDIVVR